MTQMLSQNPIYNLLVLGLSQQQQQQNMNQQQQQLPPQSPKSSRYTIAATPTKIGSSNATSNMMSVAQPQPSTPVAKGFFTTPNKANGEKKLKKRQLEKEFQMLQDKYKIMEKIRGDNDSDIERMKITLIETMTENDRLQKRVGQLEQTIEEMKSELDKGSYEAWKGYCSLQDSPPGVSSRYTKKRAISHNINSANI
ncbi:hypothetical protein DFA_00127 [Cavenderia fasciculata]|uniref:Uncharacterized protein n=1 Tax=Cavenderia fasciculata TaxID=261658 RepID=F4PXN9_CACFS|nr:uncharacterized protein DFA_00127 [Cavenderia fasciculata]EGG19549.1 hypothetical protein DFA_00127 [Cavenderia fasciculata]|eukprot:XP_004357843.1 hypothetical protein DFA_00127 [Cavenderia fasciculata]